MSDFASIFYTHIITLLKGFAKNCLYFTILNENFTSINIYNFMK